MDKIYFRDLLRNPLDGNPATNFEQSVDGSVTPVTFELKAPQGVGVGYDYFISRIRVTFVSALVQPNNWGDAGILTNGVSLYTQKESDFQAGNGIQYFFQDAVTHAGAVWQIHCEQFIELNSGAHVNGPNSDLAVIDIDCQNMIPGGIKLERNKEDFIRIVISDDLTALVSQRTYIQGYKNP